METKPQETLELAFRHLDTFSVPGVGTFKRKYFPAKVDTASKQIFPPSEEFVMEPGDEFVAILENFFFRFYKIKIDEAKAMVTQLRSHVVHELKTSGSLLVDGYGELRMSGGKEFSFIARPGDVGAASQFFGLTPLEFTLGDAQQKPKEKVEEKKSPRPAVIVPEQEPPRSVAAAVSAQGAKPEKPKEERSRAGLWAFLFLLVAVAATAGIVYRAELGSGIQQLGWFSGSAEDPENPVADTTTSDSSASNGELLAADLDPDGETEEGTDGEFEEVEEPFEEVEADPVPDEPVLEEPIVEEEVVEEVVEEEPVVVFDETVGSRPADGQYYLIVKSSKDPDDARSMASNLGGKILRPRYSGNYYRISVFNSPQKSAVIQKMVSLKSKFGKSWIYWNGM